MLESEIKKLTAAVEANTAALTGGADAAPVTVVPAGSPTAAVVAAAAGAPAARAAAEIPAPAAAPVAAAAAPAVETPAVDKKVLTQKFIELAQAKGREVAQQLLAEYNVASLPELKDKTQWPAFFAACDAKLAQ